MHKQTILMAALVCGVVGGYWTPGMEPVSGQKLVMIGKPDGQPPEPGKRGSRHVFKCGNLNARTMWGWSLELADGTGLAFGDRKSVV